MFEGYWGKINGPRGKRFVMLKNDVGRAHKSLLWLENGEDTARHSEDYKITGQKATESEIIELIKKNPEPFRYYPEYLKTKTMCWEFLKRAKRLAGIPTEFQTPDLVAYAIFNHSQYDVLSGITGLSIGNGIQIGYWMGQHKDMLPLLMGRSAPLDNLLEILLKEDSGITI